MTRVNPVSDRTAARNHRYTFLRQVWLPGRRCWIRVEGCAGYASDIHHRRSVGVDPTGKLNPLNWVAACRPCHQAVTDDPRGVGDGWVGHALDDDVHDPRFALTAFCGRCGEQVRWAGHPDHAGLVPVDEGGQDHATTCTAAALR